MYICIAECLYEHTYILQILFSIIDIYTYPGMTTRDWITNVTALSLEETASSTLSVVEII